MAFRVVIQSPLLDCIVSLSREASTWYLLPSPASSGIFKPHYPCCSVHSRVCPLSPGSCHPSFPTSHTACHSCLLTHPPGQIQGQAQLQSLRCALWYFKDTQGLGTRLPAFESLLWCKRSAMAHKHAHFMAKLRICMWGIFSLFGGGTGLTGTAPN